MDNEKELQAVDAWATYDAANEMISRIYSYVRYLSHQALLQMAGYRHKTERFCARIRNVYYCVSLG